MPGPEITLACQDYDQTRALRDGAVTAAGFELKLVSISPPSQAIEDSSRSRFSPLAYFVILIFGSMPMPAYESRAT